MDHAGRVYVGIPLEKKLRCGEIYGDRVLQSDGEVSFEGTATISWISDKDCVSTHALSVVIATVGESIPPSMPFMPPSARIPPNALISRSP